jgi:polysaccharide deacetylase family protein (PEP-CTERM system associated)
MTVDVEDYFQVSAFEPYINRADWESIPTRVEKNTHRILDMFSEKDAKATFFTLGWIAEKHPQLVKRIISEGHELASHGWSHVRVINQSPEEFREDVIKTKHYLEDISGQKIKGYRAASYSIGATNLWALDILEETGHIYSSSIYPIRHDLYGMPEAPRFPFYPNDSEGLLEIPITTFELADRRYPCGGGGFFRLLPYVISKSALKRVNKNDKQSCVFYFHPWEIDPDQPKLKGINAKTRFRHYLNLNRMEKRLECLLGDFQWDRMDKVFI